uniref:Uncharacterized protein n=1 Tax=Arundo donax TaxID=35708 RepID=A0A0A9AR76_ARUDO
MTTYISIIDTSYKNSNIINIIRLWCTYRLFVDKVATTGVIEAERRLRVRE